MRQAVLLCYLQVLKSMRRVWQTRPTNTTRGNKLSDVDLKPIEFERFKNEAGSR
jgi:hypothetical protein